MDWLALEMCASLALDVEFDAGAVIDGNWALPCSNHIRVTSRPDNCHKSSFKVSNDFRYSKYMTHSEVQTRILGNSRDIAVSGNH